MKLSCLLLLILLLISGCDQEKAPDPGISVELAALRKAAITNLKYDLQFEIPPSKKDTIPAHVMVSFDLKNADTSVPLDFNAPLGSVKKMEVNGKPALIVHENEHVLIKKGLLIAGANSVSIDFVAGEAALNRNDEYLYTLFVPSRASTCFPVFDQPDLKATFTLTLKIPKDWKAVSNGSSTYVDSNASSSTIKFSPTKPTSTYQFAFAAGKFGQVSDIESGMNIYYRETDSAKVAKNLPKIFELHKSSLAWLKEYTGIEYPYEKFDFALLPAFQFGGMEHPGAIFYRESSIFLDPSASINDELRRASLIAHETAHMWFGNLVTMRWFNDVWLKEVFANFMAAKMVTPSFPTINHKLRFLLGHFPSAYEIDRSQGAHPIQQRLDNLKNAGSIYGAIIYQKAPIMMRNLEEWIGPESFQSGLKDYLLTYAFENASWDDLIASLKKYTDNNLDVWNQAWIKTAGMPEILLTSDQIGPLIQVTNDTSGIVWPQVFQYRTTVDAIDSTMTITIRDGQPVRLASDHPRRFIPNLRGKGYGYFHGTPEYLLSVAGLEKDPEVRAGIWLTLWETFLHGEIEPILLLKHIMAGVILEQDPLLLEYLVDKMSTTYWQFLTTPQRALIVPALESAVFLRLALERDNSIKRSLFGCYRSIASTPEATENLRRLWADEITMGLELSERDHIQLAYAMAVREMPGFEKLLEQQLGRITNPDRRAEVQFVSSALSPDPSARDRFFETLTRKENRTHEPWVLEAKRYLHHPLRENASTRYVRRSLDMLEEVQKTGDIFFPKGWLDATLGNAQSAAVADTVRQFLRENPGLRPDLRNKLLQSADMLFRAEQIINKNRAIKPM